jgi:hypothetical protein
LPLGNEAGKCEGGLKARKSPVPSKESTLVEAEMASLVSGSGIALEGK